MPATQQTLSNILKEFYLGPVQEQLNNEVMVLDKCLAWDHTIEH